MDGNASIVTLIIIRAARYEENMQYTITLLNAAIMTLLEINKQILKCTQFCLPAAFTTMLLTLLVE